MKPEEVMQSLFSNIDPKALVAQINAGVDSELRKNLEMLQKRNQELEEEVLQLKEQIREWKEKA